MTHNDDLNREARDLNEMQAQEDRLVQRWINSPSFQGDVARVVASTGRMSEKQRRVLEQTRATPGGPPKAPATRLEWPHREAECMANGAGDEDYDDDIPF